MWRIFSNPNPHGGVKTNVTVYVSASFSDRQERIIVDLIPNFVAFKNLHPKNYWAMIDGICLKVSDLQRLHHDFCCFNNYYSCN
jgi:hypothetical protein